MIQDRWSVLALLRFALASIVAINHLGEYVPLGLMVVIPWFGAFEAILGFLLISGYSVGISYINKPKGFFVRRLKRLMPIYLASIALTFLVRTHLLKDNLPSAVELFLNASFLNQFLTTTSYVGPAWSLSLEFWLYCFLPLLMLSSPKAHRILVFVSFFSYVIYTCLRTLLHLPYYSGVGFGLNLVLLSFIWICGVRLACGVESSRKVMVDIGILFAGHILLTASIQLAYRLKNSGINHFLLNDLWKLLFQSATLTMMFVVFRMMREVPDPLKKGCSESSRFVKFSAILGDISYPLYLVHIPVFIILERMQLQSPILYYLISVAVSHLICRLVDFFTCKLRELPSKPEAIQARC